MSTSLESFDAEGVHVVWGKALDRRNADPEGAITIARTLLENGVQWILDEIPGSSYTDKEDLPKLYGMVARALSLAPNCKHSEEPIKAILGGAMNLVNGMSTLRNRLATSTVGAESPCDHLRVTPALPSILREAWLRSSSKHFSPDKRAKALSERSLRCKTPARIS